MVQRMPKSSERYSPVLSPSASTSAQTRPERAGEIDTPILPSMPVGKPGLVEISSQVSPPSVLRNRPLPGPPLETFQKLRLASHIEANSRRGLFGSMVRSIVPATSLR